jgi:hypothetical protein
MQNTQDTGWGPSIYYQGPSKEGTHQAEKPRQVFQYSGSRIFCGGINTGLATDAFNLSIAASRLCDPAQVT